ncbi:hypothetical protein B0T20DRAFT_433999 [Sordaria brevicollis]|uniref:DUF7580 domain-containing protein n=1 Tax=Sordaria brevicollis TaxID=83679 RepID=A0AAE0PGK9_SORBR|nr:hypothetical protein B0T20DRAFT_433999 [Sordaria brevicollis]
MEVAGLVFGVIPLAITALDKYGEAADRFGHYYRIRVEHKKWKDALSYSQLILRSHLAELLVPVLNLEQDQIRELLQVENGQLQRQQPWRNNPEIVAALKDRLQDSYDMYVRKLEETKSVVEQITQVLALESPSVQSKMKQQSSTKSSLFSMTRLKTAFSSENRSFQWYRIKFSMKGTGSRKSLFRDLEDCTNKLEKLLAVSDRNRQLTQLSKQRSSSSLGTAAEQALCSFWKHADKFYRALASTWNCRCKAHTTNLLLRHRTSGHPEFEVLLTRQLELHPSNAWKVRSAKIVADEQDSAISGSAPIHAPSHRDSRPVKSAMGGKAGGSKGKTTMFVGVETSSTQTVTLLQVKQDNKSTITVNSITTPPGSQVIRSLCTVLDMPVSSPSSGQGESSYGFFLHNKTFYHVYNTIQRPITLSDADELPTLTLQWLIDSDVLRRIERSSRYALALTVASSFLQLLDTPWLTSTALTKSDIVFVDETPDTDLYRKKPPVNRPYLHLPGPSPPTTTTSSHPQGHGGRTSPPIFHHPSDPLTLLAIILFELTYGSSLRDHPVWRNYDLYAPASHEMHRQMYDTAALDELSEDKGEFEKNTGVEEANAVRWCLWGKKRLSQDMWRNGGWRREMWVNVVEPLRRCISYMSTGSLEEVGAGVPRGWEGDVEGGWGWGWGWGVVRVVVG